MPHECPLPSCSFFARHLRVTVIFGRRFQVVFLHSTSVFPACFSPFRFAITSCISPISMHITHFVQLSCHCLRIRFLRPQKAFTAHRVPWPPFSSSPRPRHMNAPCRAGTAPSGDCEFRSGASSGVPALCLRCLSSLPLCNRLNHHSYPPTTACRLPKRPC